MPHVIAGLWIAWLVCWTIGARFVKPARWTESVRSRARHVIPLLVAAALLALPRPPPMLSVRILPSSPAIAVLGTAAVALGLGIALWARWHLGGNWSGLVTVKEDHVLIRSGPYRLVRHPIYTGLLLAFLGTAIAIGELRGALAVVLAALAFVRKLHIEEARMSERFADYARYRAEVPALIPWLW